jgi:hypothetical protein
MSDFWSIVDYGKKAVKTVADRGGAAVDWGVSKGKAVVQSAGDAIVTTKNAVVDAAQATKKAVVKGAQATKKAVGDAAHATSEYAKEKAVQAEVAAARAATRAAVKDPATLKKLTGKLDRRDQFTGPVCQTCVDKKLGKHPDPDDGKYMGKDCPKTQASRPKEGTKPKGCNCAPGGKPFPKIFFTNGINNTTKQACETMHGIADSRCAEVVGIYNATYANKNLKAPEYKWADFKDAGKGALESGAKGALSGARGGVGGALVKGGLGAIKGGAPDALAQVASRQGMIGDVLDCLDTIKGSSSEAASRTLTKEIMGAMKNKESMTVYAHSQGGLNTMASIADAKKQLVDSERAALRDKGVSFADAKTQSTANVEKSLGNLKVSTFGTVERGFEDGPQYSRYTNKSDPIPEVIRTAQEGINPSQLARDPKGAAAVERFRKTPSWNAIDAHGMNEAYLPHLNEAHPAGKCC